MADKEKQKLRMSEARYNDLVYLTLRYAYFMPVWGEEAAPRECDIRICMDMGMGKTTSPILMPNERSGRRHDVEVEVDLDKVRDVCLDYLEQHWRMEWAEGGRKRFETEVWPKLVEAAMGTTEKECGG